MTDALEGSAPTAPTFRDEANSARIGRARFIGHAIGYVLLVTIIEVGLTAAGLRQAQSAGAAIPLPNHWVALAGSALLLLALLDLAVRRRHDRNRSGIDAVVALLLLEAAAVVTVLGLLPASVPTMAVGGIAAVAGLYLLLMLALLPGHAGANRYGPPPRRRD